MNDLLQLDGGALRPDSLQGGSRGDLLGLDKQTKQTPSEEPSMVGQFARNVGGTAAGIADVGLGLPAFAGAATAALGDIPRVLTGQKRLTEVMGDVMDIAGENAPSLGKTFPSLQQNPGYQAVGETMQPGKQVGRLIEAVGQGEDMPRLEAAGKGVQENVDPMLYAMGGIAGLKSTYGPKPGSMAYYNELRKNMPTGSPGASAEARATYPPSMSAKEAVGAPGEDFLQPPHPAWSPDIPWTSDTDIRDVTEGGVGKRDTPEDPTLQAKGMRGKEGYFAPEMTEEGYAGSALPRVPGPDNNIDYRRYSPDGQGGIVDRENLPGFLKDSIDHINERFDKIRNMEESNIEGKTKLEHEDAFAKPDSHDATAALDPIPIPARVQQIAEARLAQSAFAKYTEYLPVDQVWLLRDHNRLTDPKSDAQFADKEASVLKNGLFEPLEIKYSTADGKAVLTNGNTRASLAMKHGLNEIPVRVLVTDKPLSGTEAVNGVNVGKFDVKPGQARPSDIGLMGRTPLSGKSLVDIKSKQRGGPEWKPKRAQDFEFTGNYEVEVAGKIYKIFRDPEVGYWYLDPQSPTAGKHHTENFLGFNKQEALEGLDRRLTRNNIEHTPLTPKPTGSGPGFKQRGNVDLSGILGSKKPLSPEELAKRVQKLSDIDNRPLSEVVQNIDATGVKDLDGTTHTTLLANIMGLINTAGRKVMDARTLRILNQGNKVFGEIWSNVNKRIEAIDRWKNNENAQVLYGSKFGEKFLSGLRGYAHRVVSEDGMLTSLRKLMRASMDDADAFAKRYAEIEGKEGEPSFANDKHSKVFADIQNSLKHLITGANEDRVAGGIDPVADLPNFMPHQREVGDYVLNGYSGGEAVYTRLFTSMRQARLAKEHLATDPALADLRERYPDLSFKDPMQKDIRGQVSGDLEGLMEAKKVNLRNPELRKALDSAINQRITRTGAGGHFMKRAEDPVAGYLNQSGSAKELERALVLYAEHINSYRANLKRRAVQKEFEDVKLNGPKGEQGIQETAPLFHSYMTQYLQSSRSALDALDKFDQAAMEEVGKGLGLGAGLIQRSAYRLSNLATMVYLDKVAFFASQPFQSLMSIPRMYDLAAEFNTGTNFGTKPITSYLIGAMHSIMPATDLSGKFLKGANWAIKEGYIDASLSHMLEDKSTYGKVSSTFYGTMGVVEREAVRLPGFGAIEHFLRDSIPDDTKRYEVAMAQMFRSMAGTSRSNSPLLYTQMGIAGIPVRTMKSYQTNFYGQLAEYVDGAFKEGGDHRLKPLMSFLGVTALFGGIKGVVGAQEADALITLINAAFNTNIRTPQEWVLTGGASDLVSKFSPQMGADLTGWIDDHPMTKKIAGFGLASTMWGKYGRDIQAQVGNPSSFSLLSIVPAKLVWQPGTGEAPVEALWSYAKAAAQGQLTDSIRMQTAIALTFGNPHARALIEQYYNKPGQPVPQPFANMRGNFYRDQPGQPQEQTYGEAALTGTRTLGEAQANLLYNFWKRHQAREERDRTNTLNSMTDDILNGEFDSSKIEKYVQAGGNPKNLRKDIKDTIVQRNMLGMEGELVKGGKGKGPGYAHKLQEMQPYLKDTLGLDKNPGPQSSASPVDARIQLAADTSPNIPGVSGKAVPQQPPRPNMYQGDGIVRGGASVDVRQIPPLKSSEQEYGDSIPLGDRIPGDPRSRGDIIAPPPHWRGYGQDRELRENPDTADKMPTTTRPDNPIPTEAGRKYRTYRTQQIALEPDQKWVDSHMPHLQDVLNSRKQKIRM